MNRKLLLALLALVAVIAALPFTWATQTSGQTVPPRTPTPTPPPTPRIVPTLPANKKGSNLCGSYEGCIAPIPEDFRQQNVSWVFGWGPYCWKVPGLDGVAMINNAERVQPYDLTGCSDWLLTFNEPDGNGSRIHPTVAAVLWRLIEQYFPDKYLIAPGIMWYETYNCWWGADIPGATCRWLEDWHSEYVRLYHEPPRIDALGGHCYAVCHPSNDSLTACMAMVAYLDGLRDQWGIKGGHWINEYGPYMWHPQEIMDRQLSETVMFLDSAPGVARHAPWTLRTANWATMNTMQCDGRELTSYGEAFVNAGAYRVYIPVVGR